MRRFVVIGQRATASPDFSLSDIPGTSGRLDILLRCLRAALLVSHGVRRDAVIYLVLLGGPRAPRVVRVDGAAARYLRPDERSLASTLKKALALPPSGPGFLPVRPGIAVAEGGLDAVLRDLGPGAPYLLDERGPDVRGITLDLRDPVVFLGDHTGLGDAARAEIAALGAVVLGVGPVSVQADDAVTIMSNELDRREAAQRGEPPAPA